jgi:hypothetical protein
MRTTSAAGFLITLAASFAQADEKMAKKIGMPKGFDPVKAVPKDQRLLDDPRWAGKGRRRARDLIREEQVLWQDVLPWQHIPEAVAMQGLPFKPDKASSKAGQYSATRAQRAARARARHAAILNCYGQQDAASNAASNANIAWGLRSVGHY